MKILYAIMLVNILLQVSDNRYVSTEKIDISIDDYKTNPDLLKDKNIPSSSENPLTTCKSVLSWTTLKRHPVLLHLLVT